MKLWEYFLPDPTKCFNELGDIQIIAMCIWGESRGESFRGKIGVGSVIRNRAKNPNWWGAGWKSVILKPYQFSCFNVTDPNREKMKKPLEHDSREVWEESCIVAVSVYYDLVEDPTKGANHYHDISVAPNWAVSKDPTIQIGRIKFYKL
jgi:spore germination cell wall hydrolase CwlJ-like protein